MSSRIAVNGNKITAVYDDALRPLFDLLGTMQVRRASGVDYDPESGDWIATRMVYRCNLCHLEMNGTTAYDGACECGGLIESVLGEEIARGKNRADVIAAEIIWLEGRL